MADGKARARIRLRLGPLEQGNLGEYLRVGGGVMEMRMKFGPGYRVYFGIDGPVIIVLLCGGDKKTQAADIRVAGQYCRIYKEGGK